MILNAFQVQQEFQQLEKRGIGFNLFFCREFYVSRGGKFFGGDDNIYQFLRQTAFENIGAHVAYLGQFFNIVRAGGGNVEQAFVFDDGLAGQVFILGPGFAPGCQGLQNG